MRRSDRFWAGLSSDLVIKQELIRSLKMATGLTKGRGMTEILRHQWVIGRPSCPHVNLLMQELTDISCRTSDQYKESGRKSKEEEQSRKKPLFGHGWLPVNRL